MMMLTSSASLATWLAQWPLWATVSCAALLCVLLALHVVEQVLSYSPNPAPSSTCTVASKLTDTGNDKRGNDTHGNATEAFVRFRRQYLTVYFLVMFADWLQGTHMYSLYESYGVNVGALFLTGFLSSALFGNFVGPIVDRYGRRNACLVYCALEIVINLLENVPDMTLLLVGRVLGGVSTSLLFSAFESWMVTEHRARGFAEELIPTTFAMASEGNGVLAVLAGFIAQATADAFGEIGPFRLAVAVTALAAVFVLAWPENYGAASSSLPSDTPPSSVSAERLSTDAVALGLCYSLFDGAMYVFVFLWYPTLAAVVPAGALPSGLVFSSFMLCIAIGGKLFDQLGSSSSTRGELLVCVLSAVSAAALLVPTYTRSYAWILSAFFAFEVAIGAFTPCCGALRSRYFPTQGLSSTLGLFRLPTNVLVVLGTGGANQLSADQLFCGCSAVLTLSTLCGLQLLRSARARDAARASGRAKANKID